MSSDRGRKIARAAALLVALALGAPQALAQNGASNVGKFYAYGGLAPFNPDTNPQLSHQHGDLANLIAGAGYRVSMVLSLQIDYLSAGQKLNTPPTAAPAAGTFVPGSLKTSIDTEGLALGARFNFAVGRFEPYFGGGVGEYSARIRTTSDSPTCTSFCRGSGPRTSRRSHQIGYHGFVGADYHFTQKDAMGLEFRQVKTEANFDELVPGKVDAGGSFLWMGYRRYF